MNQQKHKLNYSKLAIFIIMLLATALTSYFWYKAERWSNIVQSGDGWYSYQTESYRSIMFEYGLALQRIAVTWLVSISWSIYLGLRNKLNG